MHDFFMRFDGATWARSERVHLYLPANDALRTVVAGYHAELGQDPIHRFGLGLQPLEYLHFTLQMLTMHTPDLSVQARDELTAELATELQQIERFALEVGPPLPGQYAVELWVAPQAQDQWIRLVQRIRAVVARVLGEAALPALGSNASPHCSIGYGVAEGDSGAITEALKPRAAETPLVTVPVDQVLLVSVSQHPQHGSFSWTPPLATLPIGHGTQPDGPVETEVTDAPVDR